MKPNHIHWIWRILVCAAALIVCIVLALFFAGVFAPQPGIGFVSLDSAHLAVDDTILEQKAAQLDVPFLKDGSQGSLSEHSRALVEQGAKVLVVDLNRNLSMSEQQDLRALTAQGVTLLFAGCDPGSQFLQTCSNLAWYVGCDSAQAGETLGSELAQLYRDGGAADLNHDNLLQYLWVADSATTAKDSLLRYSLEECEHYGIYTVRTGWIDGHSDSLLTSLTEQLSSAASADTQSSGESDAPAPLTDSRSALPEVILCSSADAIRAALEARTAVGRADLPVAGFAANLPEAKALAEAGASALSVYDRDGVSQALAQLAGAALAQKALTDTGLVPTGHVFLQPFLPYEF